MRKLLALVLVSSLLLTFACSPGTPPNAPLNLVGEAVSYSIINLFWDDNSDNEDGFKIYRNGSAIASIVPNSTSYRDTGLQSGTNYLYDIRAFNKGGESGLSCSVTTFYSPLNIAAIWYVNGSTVTTAKKTDTVTARVTFSDGYPGIYTIRIRMDIDWSPDQTIQELSFTYDSPNTVQEISFVPPRATNEDSTNGYHIDIFEDGFPIWTMTDFYPPRLRIVP